MFKRITKNLYFIQGTNGGKSPNANSLLVHDEVKAIVDTGANWDDLKQVATEHNPDLVINTHFHIDHIRGNSLFPKAKMLAHPWDARIIGNHKNFLDATGLAVFGEDSDVATFYKRQIPNCKVEGFLQDDDILDFGVTKLRVIHTPGHTPGHCALFHEEEEILFAGDIDLTSFGPWYGNPDADVEDFEASIKKLRELKPRLVLTGHLEPIEEEITERFDRYLAVIEERDHTLLKFLEEPKTMEDIIDAKLIYWKHPEPVKVFRRFEELMVEKHIRRLEQQGWLMKEGDNYWVP